MDKTEQKKIDVGEALRLWIGLLLPPAARLVQLQVPLQRGAYFRQRLRHTQACWSQRPSLVIVENPAHHRTVIQHHLCDRILGFRPACLSWFAAPFGRLRSTNRWP